jgi:hypothetical protein
MESSNQGQGRVCARPGTFPHLQYNAIPPPPTSRARHSEGSPALCRGGSDGRGRLGAICDDDPDSYDGTLRPHTPPAACSVGGPRRNSSPVASSPKLFDREQQARRSSYLNVFFSSTPSPSCRISLDSQGSNDSDVQFLPCPSMTRRSHSQTDCDWEAAARQNPYLVRIFPNRSSR